MDKEKLVKVANLKKYFPVKEGFWGKSNNYIKAVDDINFHIYNGETLGLVGESGCGKSTTGRLILGLIEATSGEIIIDNLNLNSLNKTEFLDIRKKMQIIFQDPYASLNPRMSVYEIICEPLYIHKIAEGKGQENKVYELLDIVGLSGEHANRYPHELSGGQRQRVGIARALAVNPKLIIADEPVSALDVSIQAQVINLLQDLQEKLKLTYLFIAHDLAVVKHISHRICVMYLGKIVETAPSNSLYNSPLHPYTKVLLSAVPIPEPQNENSKKPELIKGELPNPINPPQGCRFNPRCSFAEEICRNNEPVYRQVEDERWVACHLYSKNT